MNKFLIISSNLNIGGAQRFVVNFANDLSDTHEVKILTIQNNNTLNFRNDLKKNIEYVCLKSRALQSVFDLRSQILMFNPDVIFSTQSYVNIVVILAKLLSGIKPKLIIREASIISNYSNPVFWLSKVLYRFTDKIVAQTQEIGESIVEKFGCSKKKVKVLPNYIDHNTLMIKAEAEELNKDKFTIMFCGRLEKVKNIDFLIIQLSKVYMEGYDFDLWIIGDGSNRDYLQSICQLKGLDFVHFFGYQLNPYPYMKQADCIVMSSIHEGFPNVLVEAMALRCIVVTNNFKGGAANDILNDDLNKYIFRSEKEFQNIIIDLITLNNQKLKNEKEKHYNNSKRFNKDLILNKYLE